MSSHVALFDMDRTLLTFNSASSYVRWRQRRGLSSTWDVIQFGFWLFQYQLGIVNAPNVARNLMLRFRGVLEDDLRHECRTWFDGEVRHRISAAGRAAVNRHRDQGHLVVLATSSTRYAAEPLCDALGIGRVICTEVEVGPDGRFTGRVLEPVCVGEGKVQRVQRWADANGLDFRASHFYTDSITDTPLLRRVAHPVAVNPDVRLRLLAMTKQWPIENWMP